MVSQVRTYHRFFAFILDSSRSVKAPQVTVLLDITRHFMHRIRFRLLCPALFFFSGCQQPQSTNLNYFNQQDLHVVNLANEDSKAALSEYVGHTVIVEGILERGQFQPLLCPSDLRHGYATIAIHNPADTPDGRRALLALWQVSRHRVIQALGQLHEFDASNPDRSPAEETVFPLVVNKGIVFWIELAAFRTVDEGQKR